MTDTGDAVASYWAAVEARDWHITVQRVIGGEQDAASEIEFTDAGVSQPGLTFFEFGSYGLISRITDYWPEPYEPPAGRAGLAERY